MIIALAGRKLSGKTYLSTLCENRGFTTIRFAFALKELISTLVGFDVDASQESKSREIDLLLSEEQMKYISKSCDIQYTLVHQELSKVIFHTVRDMLQIIGTNVIRKYNKDWHVNKLRELILKDTSKNYCIDDMRFPNELNMVNEMNGISFFVIRTSLEGVSNHESETSLTWKDFGNNIIVNNSTLLDVKKRWEFFLDYCILSSDTFVKKVCGCDNYNDLRKYICDNLPNETSICDENEITLEYLKFLEKNLLIPTELYLNDDNELFLHGDKFNKEDYPQLKCDKSKLTYKESNKRISITENPFVIENIKRFL